MPTRATSSHSPVSPMELDLQLLELAAESNVGGTGRSMSAIWAIMRERGIDGSDVGDALEILEKQKKIRVENYRGVANPLSYGDTMIVITTEGKDTLRRLKASAQFNIRISKQLLGELSEYAARRSISASEAAAQLIREGVRMDRFPGIDFRWTPTGRRPHVTGTGLSVWEVFRIWRDHDSDTRKVLSNYPALKAEHVNAGVAYAQAFVHEMPVTPAPPPSFQVVKAS